MFRSLHRPKTGRYFQPDFDHANVLFGKIVGERLNSDKQPAQNIKLAPGRTPG
jgi:hypothetical protein